MDEESTKEGVETVKCLNMQTSVNFVNAVSGWHLFAMRWKFSIKEAKWWQKPMVFKITFLFCYSFYLCPKYIIFLDSTIFEVMKK